MKAYVKRNIFTCKDTTYSKDIWLRTTHICPCMKDLDYKIVDDAHMDTFDGKHSNMHICLTFKYMETDVDYDWDENPIEYNYEELVKLRKKRVSKKQYTLRETIREKMME